MSLRHTGAGFYNHTTGEQFSLPLGTLSSVFPAEMYAILQCAKSDDLHQRHNDSIVICTDSQMALRALSCRKVTSALVLETMAALRELGIFNSVRLLWVPGRGILEYQAMRSLMGLQSKHLLNLTFDLNRSSVLLLPLYIMH